MNATVSIRWQLINDLLWYLQTDAPTNPLENWCVWASEVNRKAIVFNFKMCIQSAVSATYLSETYNTLGATGV